MVDLVRQQTEPERPTRRYIDNLYRSFAGPDGVAVVPTEEECRFDHRVVMTLARRGGMTEGQLAGYLGAGMRLNDPRFQTALSRLELCQLILRAKRPWGLNACFDELTDEGKKVACAPKGEYIGREPYNEGA